MSDNFQILSESISDIKNGYACIEDAYTCMFCKEKFQRGHIYKYGEDFLDAEKMAEIHIKDQHGDMFDNLINLDKQFTDLTDQQRNIISYFYSGLSDKDISKDLGGVTASNIRNFRYLFQKKEKQARIFLAIMELLKESDNKSKPKKINNGKDLLRESILHKYFEFEVLDNGFPKKKEEKLILLEKIGEYLEDNLPYTEKELNQILKKFHDDFVWLRRELVDYKVIERKADGSMYMKNKPLSKERRKELAEEYKKIKRTPGIYELKNKENGKIFIGYTGELEHKSKSIFFALDGNSFPFKELQEDYNKFGKESFEFNVLEVLDTKDIRPEDVRDRLKSMEKKWKEKLMPYGDKGYNGKSAK